jgi:hypothetical protein
MAVGEEPGECRWSRRLCRRITGSRSGRRRWRGCRFLLGRGVGPRDLIDGYRNSC